MILNRTFTDTGYDQEDQFHVAIDRIEAQSADF